MGSPTPTIHHESSEWLYYLKVSGEKIHYLRSGSNVVESVAK
ncbi:MAG: hypothetical protein O3A82_15460 [Verrucomicrobia bacterium]|nr:hypothetical protein [Verrucomicrobiota bacterium]